ncbi:MAG: hypothetical protein AAGA92_07820 [Planctomycetota bacterium]
MSQDVNRRLHDIERRLDRMHSEFTRVVNPKGQRNHDVKTDEILSDLGGELRDLTEAIAGLSDQVESANSLGVENADRLDEQIPEVQKLLSEAFEHLAVLDQELQRQQSADDNVAGQLRSMLGKDMSEADALEVIKSFMRVIADRLDRGQTPPLNNREIAEKDAASDNGSA